MLVDYLRKVIFTGLATVTYGKIIKVKDKRKAFLLFSSDCLLDYEANSKG